MSKLIMSDDLRRYLDLIPDLDLELLLEAYERPLPEAFRTNTLKLPEEEILQRLRDKGIEFRPIPWARYGYQAEGGVELGTTLEHMAGLIYLQGPVSMAPVEALDPKPGETVLDMCAAPGSKTTQIAQLMKGEGVLVANDISYERVKALSSNIQKIGVLNVVVTVMDGRRLPRYVKETFDKVLIDAPCSSLGIISKDWGVAKSWSYRVVERLSRLQAQLLRAGFETLKPGGTLIYSTCTLTVEENEMVVDKLLRERSDAVIKPINLPGLKHRHGVTEWNNLRFDPSLEHTLRIMPYDNWAEGFYIARIVKEG